MRAALTLGWLAAAVSVFWWLCATSKRPITALDKECARIDRELDEARGRHPGGSALITKCGTCGAGLELSMLGAHARLYHSPRTTGPEDQPVMMAMIASRAKRLRGQR